MGQARTPVLSGGFHRRWPCSCRHAPAGFCSKSWKCRQHIFRPLCSQSPSGSYRVWLAGRWRREPWRLASLRCNGRARLPTRRGPTRVTRIGATPSRQPCRAHATCWRPATRGPRRWSSRSAPSSCCRRSRWSPSLVQSVTRRRARSAAIRAAQLRAQDAPARGIARRHRHSLVVQRGMADRGWWRCRDAAARQPARFASAGTRTTTSGCRIRACTATTL